jgi:hypothetical protein
LFLHLYALPDKKNTDIFNRTPRFKMPAANVAVAPPTSVATTAATPAPRKTSATQPDRKYKCQYCARAFSRSEHRSRHERSRMWRETLSYQSTTPPQSPTPLVFHPPLPRPATNNEPPESCALPLNTKTRCAPSSHTPEQPKANMIDSQQIPRSVPSSA